MIYDSIFFLVAVVIHSVAIGYKLRIIHATWPCRERSIDYNLPFKKNRLMLSASHDLRLGMDGMLLALCDHGFERSG